MENNVFMTNLSFFIPIKDVSEEYRYRASKYMHINMPPFVQNGSVSCSCRELSMEDSIFHLIYKSYDDGKDVNREITFHPSLICFLPQSNKKDSFYILVVSVCIDKVFNSDSVAYRQSDLCTEYDLVNLKKAFFENPERKSVVLEDNEGVNHRAWLKRLIEKIDKRHSCVPAYQYSLTNIIVQPIDTDVQTRTELEHNFRKKYYSPLSIHKMDEYLKGDAKRFIFGMLEGNDNYENVDNETIDKLINHSFTNNAFDKTYAISDNVMFINVHYPYKLTQQDMEEKIRKPIHPVHLKNLQCLHEMCAVLYVQHLFDEFYHELDKDNASQIKKATFRLSFILHKKIFRMQESDKKMQFIYSSMGITDEYSQFKEISSSIVDAININFTNTINKFMILMTAISVFIGLCQCMNSSLVDVFRNIIDLNYSNYLHSHIESVICILLFLILVSVVFVVCIIDQKYGRNRGDKHGCSNKDN